MVNGILSVQRKSMWSRRWSEPTWKTLLKGGWIGPVSSDRLVNALLAQKGLRALAVEIEATGIDPADNDVNWELYKARKEWEYGEELY